MVNILDLVLKIKDFLLIIAISLYGIIVFLQRHLWRFFSLFRTGSDFEPSGRPGENNSRATKLKVNASPQISEDNSETSETEADLIDNMQNSKSKNYQTQSKKGLETPSLQKKKQVSAASSSSGATGLRKRNVMTPKNTKYGHCQVCGSNPPTMYCEGPRCYNFFCSECEAVYHKHPRRVQHIRRDISTYDPNDKPPVTPNIPFDAGVPSTSKGNHIPPHPPPRQILPNKSYQISATNVANIPPPPTMQELAAAAAEANMITNDYGDDEEAALDPNTWQCEFCTFVNQIDTRICQVCCKTSTLLNPPAESVQEVPEAVEKESPPPLPPKVPTKLTKRRNIDDEGGNFNQNNNLYDRYWDNNTTSTQERYVDEIPQGSERVEQNRSPRGRGNSGQPKNTSSAKSRNNQVPEDFDEEETVSSISPASDDPVILTEDTAATWKCSFCTLVNSSDTNICEVCGKSNPNALVKKKLNPEHEERDQNDAAAASKLSNSSAQQPVNSDTSNEVETDLMALNFMEKHHVEDYGVAQLASKLVDKNFRLQDAIEAAKNSATIDDALAYLQQECPKCSNKCLTRDMIQMVYCTHRCCESCTRRYFTNQIRNYDITAFGCPVCETPRPEQLEAFNDEISTYFADLSNMLKPILAEEHLELYQTKLRNWFLKKNTNFKQCPNCPYGGILEDGFNRMECPECKVTTCLRCQKPWFPDHVNKTCEEFAAWQENRKKKGGKNHNNKNNQPKSSEPKKSFIKGMTDGIKGLVSSSHSSSYINSVPQSGVSYSDVANRQTLAEHQRSTFYADAVNSKLDSSTKSQQIRDSEFPPIPNKDKTISTYTDHYQNPSNQSHPSKNAAASSNSKQFQNYENNQSLRNNNASSRTQKLYPSISSTEASSQPHKTKIPIGSWHCPTCTSPNYCGVRVCISCGESYDKHLIEAIEKSKLATSSNYNVANGNGTSAANIDLATEVFACNKEKEFPKGTQGNQGNNNDDDEQLAVALARSLDRSVSFDSLPINNSVYNSSESTKTTPMDWSHSPETKEMNSAKIRNDYVVKQEQLNDGSTRRAGETYQTKDQSTNLNNDSATRNFYQNKGIQNDQAWMYSKEAIVRKVPLEELQIAMSQCGEEDPFEWLNEHWKTDIAYVKLTAYRELCKFGEVNQTNNPPITDIEARNALIKHKGNCQNAVRECLEESEIKLLQRQSFGELSPEAQRVFSKITHNNGGVDVAERERIYSHQEIKSASLVNRINAVTERYSNQRSNLPATHTFGSTNTDLSLTPGLSSNFRVESVIQTQFTRVNSALDSTVDSLTQSIGITNTTFQNQNVTQSFHADHMYGNFRTSDGVHTARPAVSDYTQADRE